jgi:hypothetical protein
MHTTNGCTVIGGFMWHASCCHVTANEMVSLYKRRFAVLTTCCPGAKVLSVLQQSSPLRANKWAI